MWYGLSGWQRVGIAIWGIICPLVLIGPTAGAIGSRVYKHALLACSMPMSSHYPIQCVHDALGAAFFWRLLNVTTLNPLAASLHAPIIVLAWLAIFALEAWASIAVARLIGALIAKGAVWAFERQF